jgi:hypothetical protein
VRISDPPTVYFIPEIIEQGLWCGENVGNLFLAEMFVIALASLIVKAQNAVSFGNQSEPILEPVRTSRKWRRQAPHNQFNESVFG